MASAECENCGHSWPLQKRLEDYARGGPSCPECGSTRVEVEGESADPPARREAETPAPTRARGGSDVVGDLVRVFDDDMPARERAEGARGVLGFIAEGAARYQEYRNRKMQEQERRARSVELEPAIDYPECTECGYQFDGDDIGLTDERVRCPGCDALYNVRDVGEAEG